MSEIQSKFPATSNKVKTALNNDKLTLYTPNETGKASRLTWDLVANSPRIICYTNIPDDNIESKNWGRISANLDSPTFFAFLDILEKMADSDPNTSPVKIENRGYTYISNKRSENTVLLSELWVGKDVEGKVWMSVTSEGRPKVKFTFGLSDYHTFTHANGNSFTASELSSVMAKAHTKLLRMMYAQMLVTNYVDINALAEQRKRDADNGQGGQGKPGGYNNNNNGYNNNRGNSGGGYNRSEQRTPNIEGDDIPF